MAASMASGDGLPPRPERRQNLSKALGADWETKYDCSIYLRPDAEESSQGYVPSVADVIGCMAGHIQVGNLPLSRLLQSVQTWGELPGFLLVAKTKGYKEEILASLNVSDKFIIRSSSDGEKYMTLESEDAVKVIHGLIEKEKATARAKTYKVYVYGLGAQVSDEALKGKLCQFGNVLRVYRCKYSNAPLEGIENGIRHVFFPAKPGKTIPPVIYVEGCKAYVKYDDQKQELKCFNCKQYGHFIRECKEPCGKCHYQGHNAWNCPGIDTASTEAFPPMEYNAVVNNCSIGVTNTPPPKPITTESIQNLLTNISNKYEMATLSNESSASAASSAFVTGDEGEEEDSEDKKRTVSPSEELPNKKAKTDDEGKTRADPTKPKANDGKTRDDGGRRNSHQ